MEDSLYLDFEACVSCVCVYFNLYLYLHKSIFKDWLFFNSKHKNSFAVILLEWEM